MRSNVFVAAAAACHPRCRQPCCIIVVVTDVVFGNAPSWTHDLTKVSHLMRLGRILMAEEVTLAVHCGLEQPETGTSSRVEGVSE